MNKLLHSLLITGVLFLIPLSACAEQFNIILKGTCSITSDEGKIIKEKVSNAIILSEFAQDNTLNAADLALVFDSDVLAILVVRKSDGEEVGRIVDFEEISTVTEDSELKEVIHFLVRSPENDTVVRGSAVMDLKHTADRSGNIIRTKLLADIHFSHPASDTEDAEVCVLKMNTTTLFTPAID
jgi:hypothetical protein